ncbi:hypothetical protein R6G85_06290 [Actinotignum urinale]|uniref:hypothetical protein n=1 Tax=Actinotignum urinale TaxID=190146 RepID=UPI002A806B66|nr:hypothetical protein [Actinotignum urinale]MDY5152082.1 hypothetical protein [Actinotignum urinale]
MKKVIATVASVATLISVGSYAAFAGNHRSEMPGTVAYSKGNMAYSLDTRCDDRGTRANYATVGGRTGGVSNHSGCNSTASRNAGRTITAIQACVSGGFLTPMYCSSWNNRW